LRLCEYNDLILLGLGFYSRYFLDLVEKLLYRTDVLEGLNYQEISGNVLHHQDGIGESKLIVLIEKSQTESISKILEMENQLHIC